MKHIKYIALACVTISFLTHATTVGTIIFTNTSSGPLYIWPVPVDTPAAMAAMLPAHSLPVEFQMDSKFSNMYLLNEQAVREMGWKKINIQDPNAVITWVKANYTKDANIVVLPASGAWLAFDGSPGTWFAKQVVKY